MRKMRIHHILFTLLLCFSLSHAVGYKEFFEGKYGRSGVPEWKQKACEKASNNNANIHYICDERGDLKCLPGWQGDLCQVPMCRRGCDPMNGYCQRPGECRCRIGYEGELCDKCIPLPGCQHGYCTKPFECLCKQGWDGLFCTEPACRQGCHSTRGYCEGPNECRCRIGWTGRNCTECAVMPGCQFGKCQKPLECQCLAGYTGLLCQTPICAADCHKQHGYCRQPGECRCKVGWMGPKCDKCFPYPGCVNGDCEKPWECNCKAGWGGMLCDEPLKYCNEHANVCENGGTCISLTQSEGNYRCQCRQGYLGRNCEIVDEFLLTSTAPPRITPPPSPEPISFEDETNETETLVAKNNNTHTLIAVETNTSGNSTPPISNRSELNVGLTAAAVNLKINEVQNASIDHDLLTKDTVTYTTTARPTATSSLSPMTSAQENIRDANKLQIQSSLKKDMPLISLINSTYSNATKFSDKLKMENKTQENDEEEYDEDEYDYDEEDEEDVAENET